MWSHIRCVHKSWAQTIPKINTNRKTKTIEEACENALDLPSGHKRRKSIAIEDQKDLIFQVTQIDADNIYRSMTTI